MGELQILLDLVSSLGQWAVFFALYWTEKKSHEKTREEYRNDLREVAGLKQNLALTRIEAEAD